MPKTGPDPALRCADPACGLKFAPRKPWQKYHTARCRKRHWERVRGRGRRLANAPRVAVQPAKARRRQRRSAPRRWLLLIQF